jgi:hypothetical protein
MSDKQPLPTGVQLTAADPVFREHPQMRRTIAGALGTALTVFGP